MKFFKFLFMNVIVFLLTTTVSYAADVCGVAAENQASFLNSSDQYVVPVPPDSASLSAGAHEKYYFDIQTAGTLTITATSSGNKVHVAYSDTTCPTATSGDPTTTTVTVTSPTDINVDLFATQARSYTLTVTFQPSPLEITKANKPLQMATNTQTDVLYTLSVHNYSTSALSGVEVTDTLPSGVTIGSDANITAPGWDCSDSSAPSTIDCELLANLEANETKEINITTSAFSASATDIVNMSTVTADGGWSSSDSSTLAAVSGTGTVDLEIQKFASNNVIPPNTNFAYLMFVINYDNTDAQLVKVTDTFPADGNVSFISAGGNGWTCTPPTDVNRTFVCDYDQPLGKGITYFLINAQTRDVNNTFNVRNEATVSTLNPNSGAHSVTDYADINISTDGATGGSTFTGFYTFGGSIEVSDLNLAVGADRNNAKIQTKVASTQNTTFPVYYVNPTTDIVMDYNGTNQDVPLTVIFKLTDETCSAVNQTHLTYDSTKSVVAEFDSGSGHVVYANTPPDTTFDLRNIAKANSRLLMKYIDINYLLDVSGETCSVSNLSANIAGLPQCIANSTGSSFDNNKYINVFGIDAYVRCAIGNGQPCTASTHGIGDAPYDSEYGCYECTLGGQGYCSKDNFAIRPDEFNSTITSGQIFTAGEPTSLTFYANDSLGTGTLDYNETEKTSFIADVNISDSSKICQDMNISFNPLINFADGVVTDSYKLNNIGDFNVTIHEIIGSEFALVDENDTSNADRLITPFKEQIQVIPDHFTIDGNLTNGSDGFTYLANFEIFDTNYSRNVSASLDLNISAEAADGNITTNYTTECYAKDGDITLGLTNPIVVNPTGSLTKMIWYRYTPDDNGSFPLDGTTTLYSFPFLNTEFDNNESNGTAEFNYKINFDRNLTQVVNPFMVLVDEINATDTDEMNGTNSVDSNATFVFGRTHATRQRYDTSTGQANIYYEAYCFGSGCAKTMINGFTSTNTDDIRWFINTNHNKLNDGNISTLLVRERGVNNVVTEDFANRNELIPNITEVKLDYDESFGYPYKTTMENNASNWLIYNRDDPTATRNYFSVEFERAGADWSGEHNTSSTTTNMGAGSTNRRTTW